MQESLKHNEKIPKENNRYCKEQDKTKNVFSNFNSNTKLTFPCSKATKETPAKGVQYLQG